MPLDNRYLKKAIKAALDSDVIIEWLLTKDWVGIFNTPKAYKLKNRDNKE